MENSFNVDVRTESSYAVIQTDGYLNGPTGENLAEAAKALMRRGYRGQSVKKADSSRDADRGMVSVGVGGFDANRSDL